MLYMCRGRFKINFLYSDSGADQNSPEREQGKYRSRILGSSSDYGAKRYGRGGRAGRFGFALAGFSSCLHISSDPNYLQQLHLTPSFAEATEGGPF
jgi:hypothetical protein